MANFQSGLSKFPMKSNSRKLQGTCQGIVKRISDSGV